jgi:hypothetical protein
MITMAMPQVHPVLQRTKTISMVWWMEHSNASWNANSIQNALCSNTVHQKTGAG